MYQALALAQLAVQAVRWTLPPVHLPVPTRSTPVVQEALELARTVVHPSHWLMISIRMLLVDQLDACSEWAILHDEASALVDALSAIVFPGHPTLARILMVRSRLLNVSTVQA